jgi:heme-degrading monooxygenase HmoA
MNSTLRVTGMILEVAVLDVKSGQDKEFESAFADAQDIISSMPGYLSHQLLHHFYEPFPEVEHYTPVNKEPA